MVPVSLNKGEMVASLLKNRERVNVLRNMVYAFSVKNIFCANRNSFYRQLNILIFLVITKNHAYTVANSHVG